MMRECETCKFALITHGQTVTHLPKGMTLIQNGGTNFVCQKPGGVSELYFNMDSGKMNCASYEKIEKDG